MPTALEVANRALLRQERKQQQLVQDREQARRGREVALRDNYATAVVTLQQMINHHSLTLSAEAAVDKLLKKTRFIYNKGLPLYGGVDRIRELTSILNWVINLVHGEHSEPAIYELIVRETSRQSLEDRKVSVPVLFAFMLFEYLIIDDVKQIRFSQWKDLYDPICVMMCIITASLLLVVIEGNNYTLGDELETIGKLFNLPEEIQDDEPESHRSLANS